MAVDHQCASQLSKRVSLNGFYMYGRAYSNTDGINTLPANPYSMEGEYGPSSLDQRNRVFVGGTINACWGVLLAPFFTANSGAPFNIITGTDPYGTELNSHAATLRAPAFRQLPRLQSRRPLSGRRPCLANSDSQARRDDSAA